MIYFTSDPHFGHANILSMCGRPYADIDQMNADLISRWNARVQGGDTVYILGDLFFRCENPEPILMQLKGKKHLVLGNHDRSWIDRVDTEKYFASVSLMVETETQACGLTLCHYPLLTWRNEKRSYMIHGHIHGNTDQDFWPLLRDRERVLNAGVDVNGFQPVTLEELIENNRRWKQAHKGR